MGAAQFDGGFGNIATEVDRWGNHGKTYPYEYELEPGGLAGAARTGFWQLFKFKPKSIGGLSWATHDKVQGLNNLADAGLRGPAGPRKPLVTDGIGAANGQTLSHFQHIRVGAPAPTLG
jgi:hypothetical protein